MRTCILDLPGLSRRLLDQLDASQWPAWFKELFDQGCATIDPVVPAVTMSVQATYSTGKLPQDHGMIANGLATWRQPALHQHLDLTSEATYRQQVSFWEQSNELLQTPRRWQQTDQSVAMICVQSSMGGAADVVLTPKPQHSPDGTVSMCWSDPSDLYDQLVEATGPFPLHQYWGPMAGWGATQWIISAAESIWQSNPTDVQWVYIPQLDYDLQRFGPSDERSVAALAQTLTGLTSLVEQVQADGGRVVVLSEYGMTPVTRSLPINQRLREAGWLKVTENNEVDYQQSDCFAMCDHQVAHVYCQNEAVLDSVQSLLSDQPEVAHVYRGAERATIGLDCDRAGDLVLLSHQDAWFEYRWWDDQSWDQAPDYAWTVDIHRKPGYDPLEMFANPQTRKICADQPELIVGSHGARPSDQRDWPILLMGAENDSVIAATDVADYLFGQTEG